MNIDGILIICGAAVLLVCIFIFGPWLVGYVIEFLGNKLFSMGWNFSFGEKWLIGLALGFISSLFARSSKSN